MQSDKIARSGNLVKTRLREICWQLEFGGLKYFGQIRLGGSFWYPCTPTYSLVDHFNSEGHREVFVEFFGFLFDNMSRCYLMFISLFPYSLSFIFVIACLWLWIRVVSVIAYHLLLFCTYISLSKTNSVVSFKIRGLNKQQCFALFEFSKSFMKQKLKI